jgi:hypothetical protein
MSGARQCSRCSVYWYSPSFGTVRVSSSTTILLRIQDRSKITDQLTTNVIHMPASCRNQGAFLPPSSGEPQEAGIPPRQKRPSSFSARASWVRIGLRAPYRFVGVLRWTGSGSDLGGESILSLAADLHAFSIRWSLFDHSVLGFRNFFELQPQGRNARPAF